MVSFNHTLIRKTTHNGYSLIELLVIVSLILLMTGISIGYYADYSERQKLENVSKKVESAVQLTRAKSNASDSSLCGGANPRAGAFSFEVINSTTYQIKPSCASGIPTPIIYKTDSPVFFPTTPLSIPFYPITSGSVCSYIYLQTNLLKSSDGTDGLCRYIKINKNGTIFEDSCVNCLSCPTTCL